MSSRAWAAFAMVSVLWGMPYLFIKIALDDGVPPAFLAWSRVVLGAALLLALAWHAGVLAPLRGRWRVLLAFAVVEIALPFPLIALGEQHVSSSLAAIMIATVPLLVAVLTARFDRAQRPTGRRLVGLLVGFAGVVALVGIDVAGDGDALLGVGALALAAAGYATGPMILSRHLTAVDPRAVTGAALGLADHAAPDHVARRLSSDLSRLVSRAVSRLVSGPTGFALPSRSSRSRREGSGIPVGETGSNVCENPVSNRTCERSCYPSATR